MTATPPHFRRLLIDRGIGFSLSETGTCARIAEEHGYDGVMVEESSHDALMTLAVAALATQEIDLVTGITVAFGRSPLITAMMANDVQLLSKGRLILGLGSQVRAHIERRYSMPWSSPAARMREYIMAVRAIWACWQDGTPLNFQGEYYTHTLMTPVANPGPNQYGMPKIFLAGVGELMTEVAGEVADGFLAHPFMTSDYLRNITIPALDRGFIRGKHSRDHFEICGSAMVVTGRDEKALSNAKDHVKRQLAYFGSTKAYRGVLELYGWGELQPKLNALARIGEWEEMASLIDEDVLNTFAIVCPPEQVATEIVNRYGGMIDRFRFYTPYAPDADHWQAIASEMRSLDALL
jgi:probable F420-dependent oxidoreductase